MSQGAFAQAVVIKGTRKGLLILPESNAPFEEVYQSLRHRFEGARGFFTGARFALQTTSQWDHSQTQQLIELCRQHGLVEEQGPTAPPLAPMLKGTRDRPVTWPYQEVQAARDRCLVAHGNLRSGQRLVNKDSILVLGSVNDGAEVVSEGSVFVFGRLGGMVAAGSAGNEEAEIVAVSLSTAQLSIAACRLAVARGTAVSQRPVRVYLDQGRLCLEDYFGDPPWPLAAQVTIGKI